MKTFDQCKDEVAYRLYKTDYKYIGLAVCQVEVLEQASTMVVLMIDYAKGMNNIN